MINSQTTNDIAASKNTIPVREAHVLAEKTFSAWDPYTHALSFAHRLQQLELLDEFFSWLNAHMQFLHVELDKWSTLTLLHACTSTIFNALRYYHDKEDVRALLFEFLKFCVPQAYRQRSQLRECL